MSKPDGCIEISIDKRNISVFSTVWNTVSYGFFSTETDRQDLSGLDNVDFTYGNVLFLRWDSQNKIQICQPLNTIAKKNKMKKCIFTLLALLCCQIITAQTDGCLIVKEYSPDEWQVLHGTTYVDMDDDGEWDFRYFKETSSFMMSAPGILAKYGSCFHAISDEYYLYYDNVYPDLDTPFNDSTLNWNGTRIHPEIGYVGEYHLDTMTFKSGIRNGTEGEYYYGWMEAYAVVTYNYDSVWFYLARTCYCTIPNYPLVWGQTSLTTGFEENEAIAFTTLHPNPTTGLITIIGNDLKQAEVLNVLGQRVAMVEGTGETLQIDIAKLPAGVYFVNITDEKGHKCVRKVVKE